MVSFKCPVLFLAITAILFQSCAIDKSPPPLFFSQPWGKTFHLKVTENSDTLSIGAVFSDDSLVYINDRAAGVMVVLDRSGSLISKTPLDPIGRDTYSGDDFIVKDSQIIFLNTVDKRVEYFSRTTGKHLRSAPLPTHILAAEPKRSDRIIDRIFLTGNAVLVGNGKLLFNLESGLKKTVTVPVDKSGTIGRFALVTKKRRFMMTGNRIVDPVTGEKAVIPSSHYTIPGKRVLMIDGRLFSIIAAKDRVTIVDCGLRVAD